MGKSSMQTFLKKYDRFAKNVSLSYKKSGSYETSIGGCCSIIAFTLLAYWLIVNLFYTFKPPGEFKTSNSVSLLQNEDGTYDEIFVPQNELFTTYALESDVVSQDVINNYVTGIWLQQNTDLSLTPYFPVACSSLESILADKSDRFQSQLEGQMCADTTEPYRLQNQISGDWTEGAQTYAFVVDTCSNLVQFTNSKTCVDDDTLAAVIDQIDVYVKTASEFFSAKTYAGNGNKLQSQFQQHRYPLSKSIIQHKSYEVIPNTVKFNDAVLYTDQVFDFSQSFQIYDFSLDDTWTYTAVVQVEGNFQPKKCLLSQTFHQGQVKRKTSSSRSTIYDVFRSFGSLLSFIIRFTVLGISGMQSFSLKNSLIKKLYSAQEADPDQESDDDSIDNFLHKESENTNTKERMKKEIEHRSTFSYSYGRFWLLWRFDKSICCCCRVKKKREDFLFKDGTSKLNEEIDMLEIIKKLRVQQFAVNQTLKPYQRDLINFFAAYKLKEPQTAGAGAVRPESASVLQARATGPLANVEDSLNSGGNSRNNAIVHLYQSINHLDPQNSEIDAQIYAKVVNDSSNGAGLDSKNRQLGLSAQEVRQDMKMLKIMRNSSQASDLTRSLVSRSGSEDQLSSQREQSQRLLLVAQQERANRISLNQGEDD